MTLPAENKVAITHIFWTNRWQCHSDTWCRSANQRPALVIDRVTNTTHRTTEIYHNHHARDAESNVWPAQTSNLAFLGSCARATLSMCQRQCLADVLRVLVTHTRVRDTSGTSRTSFFTTPDNPCVSLSLPWNTQAQVSLVTPNRRFRACCRIVDWGSINGRRRCRRHILGFVKSWRKLVGGRVFSDRFLMRFGKFRDRICLSIRIR